MGLPIWETTLHSSLWINLSLLTSLQALFYCQLEGNRSLSFSLPCLSDSESGHFSKPPAGTTAHILPLPQDTSWILELASLLLLPDLHLSALHAKPLSSQNCTFPVIPEVRMQGSGTRPFSQDQVGIGPACIVWPRDMRGAAAFPRKQAWMWNGGFGYRPHWPKDSPSVPWSD